MTRVLRELRHLEGMHAAASYFRQKAELCRELAKALASQHDPVVSKLREMADEFDDNARILDRRTAREEAEEDVSADAGNLHSPAASALSTVLPTLERYVGDDERLTEVRKRMLAAVRVPETKKPGAL